MLFLCQLTFLAVLAVSLPGCSGPKPAQSATPTSAVTPSHSSTPVVSQTPISPLSVDKLFDAAHDGELLLVKQALTGDGLAVDAVDAEKRTALMLASFNGHTDVVTYLLERGADVKAVDASRRTALMFASSGPFTETVKVLLKGGADPNATDSFETWTALMFAASEGHKDVCQALLDGGADSNLKDKDGDTALNHAQNNKHQEVVDLLSK